MALIQVPGGVGGGMTLLSTLNLAGVSSATTSPFSSAYKQIFIFLNGLYAATSDDTRLRLNGDSGTDKYTWNRILGVSGSVSCAQSIDATSYLISALSTNSTPRIQNSGFVTIMKPSNTSKFFISSQAFDYDSGIRNWQNLGVYDGTAAITSVTIFSAVSFTAGTVEIYGVN